MDSEDGQVFIKRLAQFVHTHERALANALQSQRQRHKHGSSSAVSSGAANPSSSTVSISLADALSRPYSRFSAQKNVQPAKLTLTPHHLFYLLSKFEDLGVDVGPMNVRLENIHSDAVPSGYVSFLGRAPKSRGKQADSASQQSVSSIRSMISSVSTLWSTLTLSNGAAKAEKQMAQHREDVKYLYSCFTKIPALKLAPDHRARLIAGFEEFPFDTAVPLFAFKNLMALEICDLDFRQFYGWDRLAEQIRSLTLKRAHIDDPIELLQNIVLDDMEKRRKRSSKIIPTTPTTPGMSWPSNSPRTLQVDLSRSLSSPTTPLLVRRRASLGSPINLMLSASADASQTPPGTVRQRSISPPRLPSSSHGSLQKLRRSGNTLYRRSSGSSGSDGFGATPRQSTADLLMDVMATKWQFLRHLSLAENGLTCLHAGSFNWVKQSLQSLDLSGNLFTEVPDALASLENLRALNLSNCMIDSLKSLARSPLPAITTLNLRSNRLLSLAGIERVLTLERIDLRENKLHDPTELARLNNMLDIADVYVTRNPFTRTHSSYRIAIFNEFRKTPGRIQDVTIDTLGPTSAERKLLNDRVPELTPRPVVQPPPEDSPELIAKTGASIVEEQLPPAALEQLQLPPFVRSHRRTTSDLGPDTMRRRKRAPRKRIVELSQAEAMSGLQVEYPALHAPETTSYFPIQEVEPTTPTMTMTTPSTIATTAETQPVKSPNRPHLETSFTTPIPAPRIRDPSDDDGSSLKVSLELDSNTDLYRQKIEALKSEFGPNWLAALNEETFTEKHIRNRSFSPSARAPTTRPAMQSRGAEVSVGGRTLG